MTQKELAVSANLTEPTVHTAVTKLEELGIIRRETRAENRRKQYVHLTDKGRALQDVLEPLAVETNQRALSGLSDEEQAQLHGALIVVLENLTHDEDLSNVAGLRVPPTRPIPE